MVKRRRSRRSSGFGGMMKGGTSVVHKILPGLVAGIAGQFTGKLVGGQYAQPVADIGVGIIMKEPVLEVIGGRSLGMLLGSGLGFSLGGTGTTNQGTAALLGA